MIGERIAPLIPDDLLDVVAAVIGLCCMGVAARGPEHCTCWVPTFDLEQSDVDESTANEPGARTKCCHDCAYRKGSPERSDDREEWLLELPTQRGNIFWCHQGLRRVVSWTHPCGLTIPAGVGDYQPPIIGGRPIKADGSYGEICAGWLALRLGSEVLLHDQVRVDGVALLGLDNVDDLELVAGRTGDHVAGAPARRGEAADAEVLAVGGHQSEARHGG